MKRIWRFTLEHLGLYFLGAGFFCIALSSEDGNKAVKLMAQAMKEAQPK